MPIADIANGETVASVTSKINAALAALQDLVDTGGFGFATKDEGNSVLAVIANLQSSTKELEDQLKNLGLLADAD